MFSNTINSPAKQVQNIVMAREVDINFQCSYNMHMSVEREMTVIRPKTTVDPDGQGGYGGSKFNGGAEFRGKGTFNDLFTLDFYTGSDYTTQIEDGGQISVGQTVYFKIQMASPSEVNQGFADRDMSYITYIFSDLDSQ